MISKALIVLPTSIYEKDILTRYNNSWFSKALIVLPTSIYEKDNLTRYKSSWFQKHLCKKRQNALVHNTQTFT